jgi:hypothetical protein
MGAQEHFLSIRLAGQAIGSARIPATHLIPFLEGFNEGEEKDRNLLPKGTPPPIDFWQALSLNELAESQAAVPLQDVSVLFGTWPGDIENGFEELIRNLRKQNMAGEMSR